MAIREPLVLNPAGYQEVIQTGDTLTFNTDVQFGTSGKIGFFGTAPTAKTNYANLDLAESVKAVVESLNTSGLIGLGLASNYTDQINKLDNILQTYQAGGLVAGTATNTFTPVTTTYNPTALQSVVSTPAGPQFANSVVIGGTNSPATPQVGAIWVDTRNSLTNPTPMVWTGTTWVTLSHQSTRTDLGTSVNVGDLFVGTPRDPASGIIDISASSDLGRLPIGNANEILTVDQTGTYQEWRQWTYIQTTPPASPKAGDLWLDIYKNQFGIYDSVNTTWYRSYFNNSNLNDIAEETFVAGDIIRVGTGNNLERLPKGNTGEVLQSTDTSVEWKAIVVQGRIAPPNARPSDLWYNTANQELSIAVDNGAGGITWKTIGFNTVRLARSNATTPVPGMAVSFIPGGFVPTNTDQTTGKRLTGIAIAADPIDGKFWFVAIGSRIRLTEADWDGVIVETSSGLSTGSGYFLTNKTGMITKETPSLNPGNGSIDAYIGVALSKTTLLLQPNTDLESFAHSMHFNKAQFAGDGATQATEITITRVDAGSF